MGKVYLVGAGPGDPQLLTLKALSVLEKADAVIYDRLVSAEVLALANPRARLHCAGKAQGEQERIQKQINDCLLQELSRSETVVSAPAKAGIPIICRGIASSFSVIASHRRNLQQQAWQQYLFIARNLIQAGRNPGGMAAFIERGSTPQERTVTSTLFDVACGTVPVEAPAVFVIGKVVRLRKHLNQIEHEAAKPKEVRNVCRAAAA